MAIGIIRQTAERTFLRHTRRPLSHVDRLGIWVSTGLLSARTIGIRGREQEEQDCNLAVFAPPRLCLFSD